MNFSIHSLCSHLLAQVFHTRNHNRVYKRNDAYQELFGHDQSTTLHFEKIQMDNLLHLYEYMNCDEIKSTTALYYPHVSHGYNITTNRKTRIESEVQEKRAHKALTIHFRRWCRRSCRLKISVISMNL